MVVGQPVWSCACAINKGGLPTSIDPPEFTEAMLVELDGLEEEKALKTLLPSRK